MANIKILSPKVKEYVLVVSIPLESPLKWAACCNAKLVEMHNKAGHLNVSLIFSTVEDMIQFRDSVSTNVSGATIGATMKQKATVIKTKKDVSFSLARVSFLFAKKRE